MKIPHNPGEHISAPRGMLTPRDREYLLGITSYDKVQSERNVRQAIRDRTIMGLFDLALIAEHLPSRDQQLLFEKLPDGIPSKEELLEIAGGELDESGVPYAETRERNFLFCVLTAYDWIVRQLIYQQRSPADIGFLGMLWGLSRKINRQEKLNAGDLQYLHHWLLTVNEEARRETLQWLGLSELELVYSAHGSNARDFWG